MDKRGQIYILAALLLAVVIYGLSSIVNLTQQEEIKGDFESLAKNYETESSKLINSVLQSGGNVTESYENFTFLFTSYSKAKSPGFNLFYALAYENSLYIGNFMDEPITIYLDCPDIVHSCPGAGARVIELEGCLSTVPARISFEDLNLVLSPERSVEFDLLKPLCIQSLGIEVGDTEYCVALGGVMYKLPIERNTPKIFSLSRLEAGGQVLNSVQGEVGEDQVCSDLDYDECRDCGKACCWEGPEPPEAGGKCTEGKCPCGEKNDYCDEITECCDGYSCQHNHKCKETPSCRNEVCNPDENCDSCPADCLEGGEVCCDKVAYSGDCCEDDYCSGDDTCENHVCTAPIPYCEDEVCNADEDCESCPADCLEGGEVCCDAVAYTGDCCGDDDCSGDDTCEDYVCTPLECVEEGQSCEEVECCSGHYCDTDEICKEIGAGITTCTELQNMKNDLDGDYYLLNDISCFDTIEWNCEGDQCLGFEPIGTSENPFTGTFDGKGYKITGLYINRPDTKYGGLFGFKKSSTEIKNVGLENVDITAKEVVGGLVGYNSHGSISNSYSKGNVVGTYGFVGGLVGRTYGGSISKSYSEGVVRGGSNSIGGLVGYQEWGTTSNSYSTVNVDGSNSVGGLVGNTWGEITNSYSTGIVNGDYDIGGLVGSRAIGMAISNSYWDNETSGQTTSDGGIGVRTLHMKRQATFAGWDFDDTWNICEDCTYPKLKWENVECGVGCTDHRFDAYNFGYTSYTADCGTRDAVYVRHNCEVGDGTYRDDGNSIYFQCDPAPSHQENVWEWKCCSC